MQNPKLQLFARETVMLCTGFQVNQTTIVLNERDGKGTKNP